MWIITPCYILSEVSHTFGVSSPVSHMLSILSPMSHSLICCYLVQILAIGISPCHQTRVIPQIIFITRCDTPHRTIYLAWLVRLNLKVSVIQEMNLQKSTYRRDEFTRKYTSFQLSHVTREMMGRKVWPMRLTNKFGVTSEIKQRQGLS
jgi:hypothetical protein